MTVRLNLVVHEGVGPLALVVHGALGSRSYWNDNLAALAQVCRPVIVELWGHGRSPSPADPAAYTPDAYVEQFELIRADLGAERWVTIGQSMGAALTLRYGLAYPERVLAQVITNSSSSFAKTAPWHERHGDMVDPLAERVLAEGTVILADTPINPGRSRRISGPIRALLAQEFAEHSTLGIAYSLRYTNLQLPLEDRVTEVSRPTLMTLGVQEDRFVELMPRARRIPGLEVVEIQAAHAVNAQEPEAWNTAVVEFLTRVLV